MGEKDRDLGEREPIRGRPTTDEADTEDHATRFKAACPSCLLLIKHGREATWTEELVEPTRARGLSLGLAVTARCP